MIKTQSLTRILLGGTVIALGVGFLLDAINVLDFGAWIGDWWPLLIIGLGVISMLNNPRVLLWPSFIIGVGILLLLRELGAVEFNVWNLIWPSALIVLGLSFLFERIGPHPKETSDRDVDMFTAFSGIDAKNKSEAFNGGKMTALFGGITLDLRDATLKDKAVIETFTAFGGIELKVPEGWNVQTNGLPIFGGWDDKTVKPKTKNAPLLVVRGTCMFGGVEIKN